MDRYVKKRTRHETRIHSPRYSWIFIHHLIHLNNYLEIYIVRYIHRIGKKITANISTNSNVSFCGTYGCSNLLFSSHCWVLRKWMSKNPNLKSNDNNDEEDNNNNYIDNNDNKTLRRGLLRKEIHQTYNENSF